MAVRAAAGTGYLSKASAVTGAPYTVIAWFRTADVTAAYTSAFSLNNTAVTQYDYTYSSVGTDGALGVGSQSASQDTSTGAISADTWVPVVLTRTSNTRVVWAVNTRLTATTSTAEAGGYDLFAALGYGVMGSEPARDIAGFKAWNALLTNDEIAAEVQQFAPVRTANLAHYSPLHDHTDLADDIAGGSWTNNSATLSTVTGPTLDEDWDGPTVGSFNTTAATSSSGGQSINMPSGISAGDLLMAFAANDTSVSWSAGGDWSLIDNGANGTAVQGACWAKIAAGSDTLTITGEANDIAVVVVRIPAAEHGVTDVTTDITLGTAATGTGSAPDGPNCNPGTSAKRLWLTYFASDDDDDTTYWWPVEAAPISQTKSATGTSSCMVGVAYRWLEASSYNPSTFLLAASEEWRAQTFAIPAAASGIAITPGAGSITLAGFAPSANRTAHQSVAPGSGAVVLTGAAPSVSVTSASVLTPGSGALTLAGSAPGVTRTAHQWRLPDAGAVTLAGSAPSVAQTTHRWLTPGASAVVLTGAAPDVAVTQSGVISPAAGGLTLTGYAPTVTVTQSVVISPAAGALTLTGFAPTLAATGNVAITPAAGAITLAGAAPGVARTAHRWLTPGAGAVVIGGAAPSVSVSAHRSIVPDAGALTLTGYAPNFAFTSPVIVPASTEIVITGYAPNVIAIRRDRGGAGRSKRRRVIIGERIYNVLERDIPALLEAELLDRAPPVTAEVIEGPKPPRKRAKKAPQPVKTVEQVRETVQQIKARIEPDDAWLAQALEAVAFRVLERLQDEEDSLMLLLAA